MAQTRSASKTSSQKAAPKKSASKLAARPARANDSPAPTKKAKATAKRSPTSEPQTPTSKSKALPPPKAPKATSKSKPLAAVTPSGAPHPHTQALLQLRAFGLSYPETHLKSPWPEHLDLAVRDKTFAYLSIEGEPLHMSCKLPQSCQAALDLDFTEPTGYGLGKSGWVTATFKDSDEPPVEFLKTWIDESYRAQAPKSLSKTLPKMT